MDMLSVNFLNLSFNFIDHYQSYSSGFTTSNYFVIYRQLILNFNIQINKFSSHYKFSHLWKKKINFNKNQLNIAIKKYPPGKCIICQFPSKHISSIAIKKTKVFQSLREFKCPTNIFAVHSLKKYTEYGIKTPAKSFCRIHIFIFK